MNREQDGKHPQAEVALLLLLFPIVDLVDAKELRAIDPGLQEEAEVARGDHEQQVVPKRRKK